MSRKDKMHSLGSQVSGFIGILILQVIFIIVFGIFVRYDDGLLPRDNVVEVQSSERENEQTASYPRKYIFHWVQMNHSFLLVK